TVVRNIFNTNLTGEGEPERVLGALVQSSLFKTLGVKPALGRGFREEEERIGNDAVVIISDSFCFALQCQHLGQTDVRDGDNRRLRGGIVGELYSGPSRCKRRSDQYPSLIWLPPTQGSALPRGTGEGCVTRRLCADACHRVAPIGPACAP